MNWTRKTTTPLIAWIFVVGLFLAPITNLLLPVYILIRHFDKTDLRRFAIVNIVLIVLLFLYSLYLWNTKSAEQKSNSSFINHITRLYSSLYIKKNPYPNLGFRKFESNDETWEGHLIDIDEKNAGEYNVTILRKDNNKIIRLPVSNFAIRDRKFFHSIKMSIIEIEQ